MAYPTVDKPYGLKPINLIGGQVFAGSTRLLPITTSGVNYNVALFYGDVVKIGSGGTIVISNLDTETSPSPVLSVFSLAALTPTPLPSRRCFSSIGPVTLLA
jgi:hypothetical protein